MPGGQLVGSAGLGCGGGGCSQCAQGGWGAGQCWELHAVPGQFMPCWGLHVYHQGVLEGGQQRRCQLGGMSRQCGMESEVHLVALSFPGLAIVTTA